MLFFFFVFLLFDLWIHDKNDNNNNDIIQYNFSRILIFVFGILTFKLKKVKQTYDKLQNLSKYSQMMDLEAESRGGGGGDTAGQKYLSPLLPSDMDSSQIIMGIDESMKSKSNKMGSPGQPSLRAAATTPVNPTDKHKKSMTEYMVDNQAMQGDNVFDMLESQGKKQLSTVQLKQMIESNGNTLERRQSEFADASKSLNASVPSSDDSHRLRHGSVDQSKRTIF